MKKLVLDEVKKALRFLRDNHALHTLVLILLIFNTLIAASVAWLTISRRTEAADMGMGLAVDDTTAVYEAFMYDLKNGAGTNLGADGKPLDITNLDLNPYDTIFQTQNKYTPALAKIKLVRNESMPKNGTVIITINRKDMSGIAGQSLTDYSSSTLRFTGFIIEDKRDVNITDPAELYSSICTDDLFREIEVEYKGKELTNSKTFVTVIGSGEGHTHDKYDSIQIFVDYENANWYTDEDGNETLNVYLYISYDVQLINCFLNENQGGGISLGDTTFFFKNDLMDIRISYTE